MAVYRQGYQRYDGPLTMATDYMVWNVTQDAIEVREVHYNPDVWPPPAAYPKPDIDQAGMVFVSDEIDSRRLPEAADVDQAIYDRINAQYGTNFRLGR